MSLHGEAAGKASRTDGRKQNHLIRPNTVALMHSTTACAGAVVLIAIGLFVIGDAVNVLQQSRQQLAAVQNTLYAYSVQLQASATADGQLVADDSIRLPASVLGVLWSAQLDRCSLEALQPFPSPGVAQLDLPVSKISVEFLAPVKECPHSTSRFTGPCAVEGQVAIRHTVQHRVEAGEASTSDICRGQLSFVGVPVSTHKLDLQRFASPSPSGLGSDSSASPGDAKHKLRHRAQTIAGLSLRRKFKAESILPRHPEPAPWKSNTPAGIATNPKLTHTDLEGPQQADHGEGLKRAARALASTVSPSPSASSSVSASAAASTPAGASAAASPSPSAPPSPSMSMTASATVSPSSTAIVPPPAAAGTDDGASGLGAGGIAGIVLGVLGALLGVVAAVIWYRRRESAGRQARRPRPPASSMDARGDRVAVLNPAAGLEMA